MGRGLPTTAAPPPPPAIPWVEGLGPHGDAHQISKGMPVKTNACAVLAAALSLIAAGPAAATADLLSLNMGQTNEVQAGTFAGFRLRMALGGRPDEARLRGGFTVAP